MKKSLVSLKHIRFRGPSIGIAVVSNSPWAAEARLSSPQNGLFPDRQECEWDGNGSVSRDTELCGHRSIRVDCN